MNQYLQQKASSWVSMAVLAGGVVSAFLLFFLYRVENNIQAANANWQEQDLNYILEQKGY